MPVRLHQLQNHTLVQVVLISLEEFKEGSLLLLEHLVRIHGVRDLIELVQMVQFELKQPGAQKGPLTPIRQRF